MGIEELQNILIYNTDWNLKDVTEEINSTKALINKIENRIPEIEREIEDAKYTIKIKKDMLFKLETIRDKME